MKTFSQFMIEAEGDYDHEFQSGAQIRTTGEGGRTGRLRKQSSTQARRFKTVIDPKTGESKRVPISYKPRADIGSERSAETRQQQPEQERGSANVAERQKAAARAAAKEAARKRREARARGEEPSGPEQLSQAEIRKKANELLSKKAPKPKSKATPSPRQGQRSPLLHPKEPDRPVTRDEKAAIMNVGHSLQQDIVGAKDERTGKPRVEKDAQHYMQRLRKKSTAHPQGRFGYTQARVAQDEKEKAQKATIRKKKTRQTIRRSMTSSARRRRAITSAGERLLSDIQQGKD